MRDRLLGSHGHAQWTLAGTGCGWERQRHPRLSLCVIGGGKRCEECLHLVICRRRASLSLSSLSYQTLPMDAAAGSKRPMGAEDKDHKKARDDGAQEEVRKSHKLLHSCTLSAT